MVKVANLKPYHISILHYWNMEIRWARKIHAATKIPLCTIGYQLKKLRIEGSLQHRKGNGRKRMIYGKYSQASGQLSGEIRKLC